MNRRNFVAAVTASTACSSRRADLATPVAPSASRRFAPVHVSNDRIIRTIVGLRPYRRSGFVVRTEKIEGKTIVHNYGHGGAGITLSWGTSHLAVQQVLPLGVLRAAVLGAGAVGLAAARLLQEHGIGVTIYAKDLPPSTTSNIAGGQWSPYTLYDEKCVTPAFMAQFLDAARFSYRRFQLMVGDYYGIRWLTDYLMDDQPFPDTGINSRQSPIAGLLPELRDLAPNEHPFPFPYVRQFDAMYIEPYIYLETMLREIRIAGGAVVVKEMRSVRDVLALPESVVVNCTGLGAKQLFNDSELTPIKGQLTILLPEPEVDYCIEPGDNYMFPRRDGILLGGTHEMGNWSLEPNLQAEKRIVAAHAAVFRDMRQT